MSAILDLGVQLQAQYPDANVIKYTATSLQRYLKETNATLYVQYLLQLAFHQSTVLPQIAEVLLKYEVDVNEDVIGRLVERHLQFRRSDAVCWTLTIASLAGVDLSEDLASEIVKSEDVMAMGMLIALNQHVDLVDAYKRRATNAKTERLHEDGRGSRNSGRVPKYAAEIRGQWKHSGSTQSSQRLLTWYRDRAELVGQIAAGRRGSALKKRQYERIEYARTKLGQEIPAIEGDVLQRLESRLKRPVGGTAA